MNTRQRSRISGFAFEHDGFERALAAAHASEIDHLAVKQTVAVAVEFGHRPYGAAGRPHPERKLLVRAFEEEAPDTWRVEGLAG